MRKILPETAALRRCLVGLLLLRAIVPAGYMPGSLERGTWFELCPEGLPVAVIAAFAGDHHHHATGDGPSSAVGDCSFGDLLNTAAVHAASDQPAPPIPFSVPEPVAEQDFPLLRRRIVHAPRAPPIPS